ncbi:AgmX/PglI C-terminal domain-containing protein [Marinobacter caseinilyticus]|uniref:AgmX/PglI C-terminal domain-containing protein n=1 Tax=Marinobacter caseinilyticus TaxID=2692195 RepID=UPI001F174591|nr:AgmX/PglI C-terminal domain-containing protein [Marinobacter caseinilyticus]
MADCSDRSGGLPWSSEPGERLRLGLSLGLMLVLFVPLAVVVTQAQLPEPDRAAKEPILPQLARFVKRKPPPEAVKPQELVPVVEEAIPPTPDVAKLQPKQESVSRPVQKPVQEPVLEPRQTVEQARDVAARSGLLAMQDQLAAMREPESPTAPSAMAVNVRDQGRQHSPAPDLAKTLAGSGGVQEHKGPVREVAVAEHAVKQVAAPADKSPAAPSAKDSVSSRSERAMSNIRRVMDNQKSVLYAIYNRELRQDPTLEGTVLLELVIEPDGRVSDCKVISSELNNPALEARLANRIRLFNFGKADVDSRTLTFPLDFLPS